MKWVGVIVLCVLLVATASASIVYNETQPALDPIDYDDELYLVGDVLNITVYPYNTSSLRYLSNHTCLVYLASSPVTMNHSGVAGEPYWAVHTFNASVDTINVNCNGSWSELPLSVSDRWVARLSSPVYSMASVPITYEASVQEYDTNHDLAAAGSCTINATDFVVENVTHGQMIQGTYLSAGSYNIAFNCSFPLTGSVLASGTTSVTAYEPQLLASGSNPFSSYASSSRITLGSFDIDGDSMDEVLMLGSSGLSIFNGSNLSHDLAHGSGPGLYGASAFFVTDMDFDGDGDVLLDNGTSLHLLSYDAGGFSPSTIATEISDIGAFGAFEINNDFYKDALMLNGSANTWDYTLYRGTASGLVFDSSGRLNLSVGLSCKNMLIFDYDKDAIQELVCLSSFDGGSVALFDRSGFLGDLHTIAPVIHNLGFDASDLLLFQNPMFFSDIDADGEWELGVVELSTNDVHYFENLSSTFDPVFTDTMGGASYYGQGGADLMHSNNRSRLYSLLHSGLSLSMHYDGLISQESAQNYFGSPITLAQNDSSDLLAPYFSGDYKVAYLENDIARFVPQEASYSVAMTLKNFSLSETNETHSLFTEMRFEPSASWRFSDYEFWVRFIGNNNVYRNDYFDSQQNLKYHLVNASGSYSFAVRNDDAYTVDFALNRFANTRTAFASATKQNDACICFFSPFCDLVSTCQFDGSNTTQFLATSINISGAQVLWDAITTNASIRFSDLQPVGSSIRDSQIFNASILFDSGGDLSLEDSTLSNTTLRLVDVNLSVEDSILDRVFVNGSSNLSIQGGSVASLLTGSDFTGRVILNQSSVSSGFFEQGHILYYNVSESGSSSLNATQDYFNCTRVSAGQFSGVVDQTAEILSESSCFLMRRVVNGTAEALFNYSFTFDTGFAYFPWSPLYSAFDSETVVTLNRTFLPVWDYVMNGSWQTDFRNYSLLQNISNLSSVRFSYGSRLNVTVPVAYNYSGLNLTGYVQADSAGFTLNGTILNLSAQVSYAFPFSSFVVSPYAGLVLSGSVLSGLVPPGTYTLSRDLNASAFVPSRTVARHPFNVSVTYSNLNGSYKSSGCTLYVNGSAMAFNDVTLNDSGVYGYSVICSDSKLESINLSGSISVFDSYLTGLSQAERYVPFTVWNNHPYSCSGSLVLNSSRENHTFHFGSGCTAELTLKDDVYSYVLYGDGVTENGSFNVSGNPSFFSIATGIAGFEVETNRADNSYFIISEDSFITKEGLNLTDDNLYNTDEGLETVATSKHSTFFYEGVLFNDGVVHQVVNG